MSLSAKRDQRGAPGLPENAPETSRSQPFRLLEATLLSSSPGLRARSRPALVAAGRGYRRAGSLRRACRGARCLGRRLALGPVLQDLLGAVEVGVQRLELLSCELRQAALQALREHM